MVHKVIPEIFNNSALMADAILIGSDIIHCEKSFEVGLANAGMCFNGVHLENITVSKNWVCNDCN